MCNGFRDINHAPRLEEPLAIPRRRVLGVHTGGHDASLAMVENGRITEVIEFERVFREKRCRIFPGSSRFKNSLQWYFEEYGGSREIEAVALQINRFHEELYDQAVEQLKLYVPGAKYVSFNHHLCHGAASYFTSPFHKSVIISIDGYGNDGTTVAFSADGNRINYHKRWPYCLGKSYRALGAIIGGIHSNDLETAGKTMGLTAYGRVNEAWKFPISQFLRAYRPRSEQIAGWEPALADGAFTIAGFGAITGANTFDGPESTIAQDFAATFQECWTELLLEIVRQAIQETGCPNVCLTGGAALNVVANSAVTNLNEVEQIHFVPNPNDAGLSAGAALYYYYGYQGIEWAGRGDFNSPYLGIPILDINELPIYARTRSATKLRDPIGELAGLLAKGEIVGVITGRSEIGPRALGHRSILADPRDHRMKEVLNVRVKGREWYRPIAPVVREEDVSVFFETTRLSPYMSMMAHVKDGNNLPAVTHIDRTARYQTVSYEQNSFLYDLLTAFATQTGVGVLVNTSFNGKGAPMVASLSEALQILDTTDVDAVYCEGWLFNKLPR